MRKFRAPTGLPGFTLVASGQLVSILGSKMSQFELMLWAFEQTGLATSLALIGFFHFLPLIVVSPFAGALVDRSNRKLMMMLSDLGSAAATPMVFGLYLGGGLQIWHLYLAAAVSGAFHAFQWPAFSAAVSIMDARQLHRPDDHPHPQRLQPGHLAGQGAPGRAGQGLRRPAHDRLGRQPPCHAAGAPSAAWWARGRALGSP